MLTNTWNNAVRSAITIILGVSGLAIAPNVRANTANFSEQNTAGTSQVNNPVAVQLNDTIQEFLTSKLYSHQWQSQQAVTLHFQNIPLLTFVGNDQGEINARAREFASRLDQLHQQQADANKIAVRWDSQRAEHLIQYDQEDLIALNDGTILPDSTTNAQNDALQATNRLRRLLGNAEPITSIIDQPEQVIASGAGVKGSTGRVIRGIASWYGPGFHGRRTANGERFNQNALTAAHRSLPFGTRVKVTNVSNGRSVVVRINDRGPFTGGRVIDLAAGAAQAIGLKSRGVGPVTIQVLGR
ncbi:septal ring lytic transglycosylase RlpA family protein [Cyanobacterium stanieri LEGE 03274]|uniref:Probable endolytic peptidoglycan transglycosylase RlpA n=1 Tax=Cyanobacterium stanieri LEGE 03274 TaxID=1828756 RepID=A0ABR9V4J3_9CHRO|nr:septal ring lytic transglycosylase RlpA family protein [Cyanobacterium stanieri]MBE9222474.1 septal ring lytic transglycosylase RlpA family protein [Cyanobacterium stanieri LEGE 03274]